MTECNQSKSTGFWEVLSSHTIYSAHPYITLTVETVRVPDGRIVDDYHQVQLPDFAIAVPVLTDGRILTLWQYKHGARCYSMTFPAGHIEAGEEPSETIKRELREETGYSAKSCIALGNYWVNGSQGCGRCYLFVLTGCELEGLQNHHDLERWDVRLMNIHEVEEAIKNGHCAILPHFTVWLAYRQCTNQ